MHGPMNVKSVNFLPTFQDNLPVPSSRVNFGFLTNDYGTSQLSRNVGKKLTLLAA